MNRRDLLAMLVPIVAGSASAVAQTAAKPTTIGFMRGERPPQEYLDAFEGRLRGLGYAKGKDIQIEYRFSDAGPVALARAAEEFVASKVDIIVAAGAQATRAAKQVTSVIPIVMTPATDPVTNGFVASLSRPGGNVTGIALINWELLGKRVQLLNELLPNLQRVGVLFNLNNPAPSRTWEQAVSAAALVGATLQRRGVRDFAEVEPAFAQFTQDRVDALIVVQSPVFDTPPYQIVQIAAANRVPTVYGLRLLPEAGGLLSYGPNVAELYAQAASYVVKILRGAKPGDLPVEQPTKIELVINLRTARNLGLAVPQSLLVRADDIIR
jgi:putative ABC transport system substrate-binding protein